MPRALRDTHTERQLIDQLKLQLPTDPTATALRCTVGTLLLAFWRIIEAGLVCEILVPRFGAGLDQDSDGEIDRVSAFQIKSFLAVYLSLGASEKSSPFFSTFPMLSRACLGKNDRFYMETAQRGVFRRELLMPPCGIPGGEDCCDEPPEDEDGSAGPEHERAEHRLPLCAAAAHAARRRVRRTDPL
jgi:hypothetical protein